MRAALLAAACICLAGCASPGADVGDVSVSPEAPAVANAFGRIAEVAPDGEATRVVVAAEAVDCERETTRYAFVARFEAGIDPPAVGATAGIEAMDPVRNGTWYVTGVYASLAEYAEACRHRHAYDLGPGRTAPERPSGTGTRVVETPVVLGEPTRLVARLVNAQDRAINARLVAAYLFNEEARVRVAGCPLDYDAERNFTVRDSVERAFVAHCALDADARPTYEDCSARHAAPGTVGGQGRAGDPDAPCEVRSARPLASLWAEVEFTDELGARHVFDGPLLQALYLGHAVNLTVEAPRTIRGPDEFRVVVRYLDAVGDRVPGAQVVLHLEHPGLERHSFSMPWDDAAGAWTFGWDDLHEWKPARWEDGPRRVEVEASAPGGTHVPASAVTVIVFQ